MSSQSLLNLPANQSTSTKSYHNYTDINALNDLRKEAREDERAALRPVAEQFEALFVQQVLKEARKVSFDDNWLDSQGGDTYKDWYDKQLSQDLSAKGTLGFADKLVEQLAPKHDTIPVSEFKALREREANGPQQTPTAEQSPASTHQALAIRNIK